jgi:hypothetical protein
MTTLVRWGESVDRVMERLGTLTLLPSLQPFSSEDPRDPSLHLFFGNFIEESGAFAISTDSSEVREQLFEAMRQNTMTASYKHARAEYEAKRLRPRTASSESQS